MSVNVTSIEAQTAKRAREARKKAYEIGEAMHAARAAFAFRDYNFNPDGFGSTEEGRIVMLLDEDALTGVWMSPMDALASGAALVEAAIGALRDAETPKE